MSRRCDRDAPISHCHIVAEGAPPHSSGAASSRPTREGSPFDDIPELSADCRTPRRTRAGSATRSRATIDEAGRDVARHTSRIHEGHGGNDDEGSGFDRHSRGLRPRSGGVRDVAAALPVRMRSTESRSGRSSPRARRTTRRSRVTLRRQGIAGRRATRRFPRRTFSSSRAASFATDRATLGTPRSGRSAVVEGAPRREAAPRADGASRQGRGARVW